MLKGRGRDEGANHFNSRRLRSGAQSALELEPQNYTVGLNWKHPSRPWIGTCSVPNARDLPASSTQRSLVTETWGWGGGGAFRVLVSE